MVSKAADKSNRTSTAVFLPSAAIVKSFFTRINAVSVLWHFCMLTGMVHKDYWWIGSYLDALHQLLQWSWTKKINLTQVCSFSVHYKTRNIKLLWCNTKIHGIYLYILTNCCVLLCFMATYKSCGQKNIKIFRCVFYKQIKWSNLLLR